MNNPVAITIPVSEPQLSGNARQYLLECVDSGWVSSKGRFVTQFETEFAQLIGVKHAISVSNGTAALHLALLAAGIGPGDEVLVPDLTFAATANAVIHCGAVPVLTEVCRQSWTIDMLHAQSRITERTRAIIPVHLYGVPANMAQVTEFSRQHQLVVVEDCAESLGALFQEKATGCLGHLGCFSFFANKLITTGEGGMVTTDDDSLAEKVRCLRDHGMLPERRYWHQVAGLNYRMTNMQAALGVAQLEQYPQFLLRRAEIANTYRQGLAGLPGLSWQQPFADSEPVCWLFSFTVDKAIAGIDATELRRRLAEHGIESRGFFYPLHQQPPYKCSAVDFAVSQWLAASGVSLPTYTALTEVQLNLIIKTVQQCLK